MIIEVCGPGCPRCQATEKNVLQALKELGKEAEVVKVKDFREISARGVMMTPAVIIDGVKAFEGRIPSAEEIKNWLQEKA
ncbi:MAG: TM0996/MTH895 family glutaredoxin-like protein [Dehalococcoidia bacterium]|nr:MAG: TM0996/MTH895 family glutaredoxin-like protein [Dehalococcoidia bacterium]